MAKGVRSFIEYLKEVGWALFLIYLFLALLVLIFREHVELATAIRICLGYALFVTAIFTTILLCNVLGIGIAKLIRHIRQKLH